MTQLSVWRIAEAIDGYRKGEVSAKVALVAIGIVIDAARLIPPKVSDLTKDEANELEMILNAMMKRQLAVSFNSTTSTPIEWESTDDESS